ncbi:MAG: F0F1 ATP synthase subunit alpha, partial [Nitrospirae bacterium]|nr:F0F1 ATP synthase subunit alpha [Nitrospirota bacterium]
ELAAFAQFGSDLDKSTLAMISRGKRMVEVLKQSQYVPMAIGEQVLVLFTGSEGFLDDLPVEKVVEFEKGLLTFARAKMANLLKEITDKKALDDELKKKLAAAVSEYKAEFAKAI